MAVFFLIKFKANLYCASSKNEKTPKRAQSISAVHTINPRLDYTRVYCLERMFAKVCAARIIGTD